jgi:hypothetical protein
MYNIKDLDSEFVHLYVVEFRSDKYNFLKVGLTSRSIEERFKPKQYSVFNKITLLDREVPAIMGIELERTAIERFDSQRYYLPKGIAFKGCTELFKTCAKSDLLSLLGVEDE